METSEARQGEKRCGKTAEGLTVEAPEEELGGGGSVRWGWAGIGGKESRGGVIRAGLQEGHSTRR